MESGSYDSFDEFLDEFFPDDVEARERIERGAERLAAEERGARLIELRERARATREDVAGRMGVEVQRVIDLEAGAADVDLHRIDDLRYVGPEEADAELRNLVRYITELSSYIQAIGGDIQLELSGVEVDARDPEAGAPNPVARSLFVPAPAGDFTPQFLSVLLRNRPARLVIWAEVEGWRTDIAA